MDSPDFEKIGERLLLAMGADITNDMKVAVIAESLRRVQKESHNAAVEACAKVADAYADENIAMAGDTVLLDPVLSGDGFTVANIARSKDLQIDGCVHSSMFHAAQNIAEDIRKLGRT